MTQESLTEKLATHLMRPVDEATRQRARLHLLDWLGCVAGARQSEAGESYGKLIVSPEQWYGNVLEMDDVHRSAILHPGPVVWPSAFHYADNMDDLLVAAVAGYEAMIAIGSTFDDQHYSFWHPTSTAGIFGSAAAHSAGMNGFNVEDLEAISWKHRELVSTLGLAGTVTGGLWQTRHENDDAKQFHIVNAIEAGRSAVGAALNKVQGPRFILEGPQGLYAATCKNPKPMIFPEQWRIHEVSFKPWGACRHAHPAIDAALELKAKLGSLDGDIQVETYADAIKFCDRSDPKTVIDAKFSLQHAVAVVAERGVPQLVDFEPEAIASLADIRARVSVSEAGDITKRYPEHYGARLTCRGEHIELVDTLGDPERPLSKMGIIEKARALIIWGGLPTKEVDRAVDLALNGDDPTAISKMLTQWLS